MSVLAELNTLRGQGHSGQLPQQQEVLRETTKGKAVYFETGFNIGHSSYFVLENNPKINVISFSLFCKASEQAYIILKQEYGDRIEVVWGDSREQVPKRNGLYADVAFIDGGHQYDVARQDLHNAERHMNPQGIVIMDDAYCEAGFCQGPTRAWTEIVEEGRIIETARHDVTNFRGFAVGKFSL